MKCFVCGATIKSTKFKVFNTQNDKPALYCLACIPTYDTVEIPSKIIAKPLGLRKVQASRPEGDPQEIIKQNIIEEV